MQWHGKMLDGCIGTRDTPSNRALAAYCKQLTPNYAASMSLAANAHYADVDCLIFLANLSDVPLDASGLPEAAMIPFGRIDREKLFAIAINCIDGTGASFARFFERHKTVGDMITIVFYKTVGPDEWFMMMIGFRRLDIDKLCFNTACKNQSLHATRMMCTQCKAAFYCGPACQLEAWAAHKTPCKAIAAAVARDKKPTPAQMPMPTTSAHPAR